MCLNVSSWSTPKKWGGWRKSLPPKLHSKKLQLWDPSCIVEDIFTNDVHVLKCVSFIFKTRQRQQTWRTGCLVTNEPVEFER
jgi:hypothetical protein